MISAQRPVSAVILKRISIKVRSFTQFNKSGGLNQDSHDHGLVFRSFIYLFDELAKRSEEANFVIRASYLEIYNEKVIDLLNPGPKRSNLTVRWSKKSRAFIVDNLFSIECSEMDDLVAVLEEGRYTTYVVRLFLSTWSKTQFEKKLDISRNSV